MNKIAKIVMCIIIFTFAILFSVSCEFDESKNHLSGGLLLDDNKMSEIKNEIISEMLYQSEKIEFDSVEETISSSEVGTFSESDAINETNTEANSGETEANPVVYWTKSGSVWHISNDCRYIRNSAEILNGSIDEAKNAGKVKICSGCGK